MQTGALSAEGGASYPHIQKGNSSDPANYRGITVTTVLLKVIEHVLNIRHNAILDASQSRLQKGFPPGRLPLMLH